MLFTTIVASSAALLSLFAAPAAATPTGMEKRAAGPSGSVVTPAGGYETTSFGNFPTAKIPFQYKTVYKRKQDTSNCSGYGCFASTLYVDVSLKTASATYKLAEYLGAADDGGDINAYLVVPKGVCGDARLLVREYQNTYGKIYDFQSAAPLIHIACAPVQ